MKGKYLNYELIQQGTCQAATNFRLNSLCLPVNLYCLFTPNAHVSDSAKQTKFSKTKKPAQMSGLLRKIYC